MAIIVSAHKDKQLTNCEFSANLRPSFAKFVFLRGLPTHTMKSVSGNSQFWRTEVTNCELTCSWWHNSHLVEHTNSNSVENRVLILVCSQEKFTNSFIQKSPIFAIWRGRRSSRSRILAAKVQLKVQLLLVCAGPNGQTARWTVSSTIRSKHAHFHLPARSLSAVCLHARTH